MLPSQRQRQRAHSGSFPTPVSFILQRNGSASVGGLILAPFPGFSALPRQRLSHSSAMNTPALEDPFWPPFQR
jgi:hypothetical protein